VPGVDNTAPQRLLVNTFLCLVGLMGDAIGTQWTCSIAVRTSRSCDVNKHAHGLVVGGLHSSEALRWSKPGHIRGESPAERNGHSATLIDGEVLLVIGGWLGEGPLAAEDIHALHIRTPR